MQSADSHRAVHNTRDFYSRLCLWLAPYPLFMGWIFLVAGIGVLFIALGVGMTIAGVALHPSWRRLLAAVLALAVGCAPIWFILAWFAFGFGD